MPRLLSRIFLLFYFLILIFFVSWPQPRPATPLTDDSVFWKNRYSVKQFAVRQGMSKERENRQSERHRSTSRATAALSYPCNRQFTLMLFFFLLPWPSRLVNSILIVSSSTDSFPKLNKRLLLHNAFSCFLPQKYDHIRCIVI